MCDSSRVPTVASLVVTRVTGRLASQTMTQKHHRLWTVCLIVLFVPQPFSPGAFGCSQMYGSSFGFRAAGGQPMVNYSQMPMGPYISGEGPHVQYSR